MPLLRVGLNKSKYNRIGYFTNPTCKLSAAKTFQVFPKITRKAIVWTRTCKWSYSCWNTRAGSPVKLTSNLAPVISCASTFNESGLCRVRRQRNPKVNEDQILLGNDEEWMMKLSWRWATAIINYIVKGNLIWPSHTRLCEYHGKLLPRHQHKSQGRISNPHYKALSFLKIYWCADWREQSPLLHHVHQLH